MQRAKDLQNGRVVDPLSPTYVDIKSANAFNFN